jgi:hypothetical protein
MFKNISDKIKTADEAVEKGEGAFCKASPDHPERGTHSNRALPGDSGWTHEPKSTSSKCRSDVSFLGIFANLVGLVTFFGCWFYFITTFGWFFGLALGWIPALLIALLVAFMSPMIIVLLIIIAFILFGAVFSGSFPLP